MIRYKILDIFVKKNNNISLETFNCFISAIKKNPNIEIALICSMDAEESEHIRCRVILQYEVEYTYIVKLIIEDFYPVKSRWDEQINQTKTDR